MGTLSIDVSLLTPTNFVPFSDLLFGSLSGASFPIESDIMTDGTGMVSLFDAPHPINTYVSLTSDGALLNLRRNGLDNTWTFVDMGDEFGGGETYEIAERRTLVLFVVGFCGVLCGIVGLGLRRRQRKSTATAIYRSSHRKYR